ncbi:Hypothetical predicted protein [Marmota monax]|uniref:Protein kinase domain-containing protein n=1 Tax=Marmota monax TaxID=9995 RepID=A0A5E4BHM0_MARMO|nr:Hypothetical predicted protein [Marmota monax]
MLTWARPTVRYACLGQSLAHVLKARQTLTEPEVRYYLRGVIGGLRYLHQQRIVHRDLKLSNLFLNKKMEVKIGDLGLATRLGPGGRCHRVLCGTPNLLAPEVVSRKGHSCPSDIWALGCIMYTVLTGTPPFAAASLSEMYQNIRDGHYPEPAHLSPNARRLIARLLAPDPAERPNLDHLLQDDFFTQGFTPDRMPPRSRHSPPAFTFPQPVGSLFRKVGQLLSTQCGPPSPALACPRPSLLPSAAPASPSACAALPKPCAPSGPCTSKEASGPGEEGPEPDSLDWGSEVRRAQEGTAAPKPCPSQASRASGDPQALHLLPSARFPLGPTPHLVHPTVLLSAYCVPCELLPRKPFPWCGARRRRELWGSGLGAGVPHLSHFLQRPPCLREGLTVPRPLSTCSHKGPSGATRQVSRPLALAVSTCRRRVPSLATALSWSTPETWGTVLLGPQESPETEVAAAIRNLQLCLDAGPVGRSRPALSAQHDLSVQGPPPGPPHFRGSLGLSWGPGGLRTGACGDGPQVEREIALHSRLRHHNIVAFHGHFADRDHVYMVLEYCSRQVLGEGEPAARPLSICSHPCQCHLLFSVQSTCFLCPCMAICVHPSLTCAHQEPPVPTCAHLCSVHAVVIRLISCSCVATVPT